MPGNKISDIRLNMGGMHNVENMMAAIGVANELAIEPEKIKAAVATFKGVKRRFEYIINQKDLVFVDDYAHHPEELKALINGVKTVFPGKRCTLIFQPHLFTRTRDFATAFAEVLGGVDNVVLLPIYPARELPIDGVTSSMVLDHVQLENRSLYTKEQLLHWIETEFSLNRNREPGEVLITAGAGDIDKLVAPIKQILTK
ncbi:glutamate ligase domain-containing protein [Niabella hibiscisoli]|uniref:glutamate ligase domain-containing protein n=1 Tax=Niabella hibiscisoli TaxID=1825928 RepID=UPI0021D42EB4|nr:cyanophycin synthetase [Niabella hibiscisoli]